MTSSVRMFDIGNSGLQASRQALSTTGHNIANVNTEGYSRQRVEQNSGPTIAITRGNAGSGVRVSGIIRTNDEYLTRRIEQETKNFAHSEERDTYLGQTEQIFNEANTEGLNRLATNFFNEFRKLSVEPENPAIRSAVRESSNRLAGDIRRIDTSLKEVQKNVDNRIDGYVREFNTLIKEVSELNGLIDKSKLGAEMASPDLLDKRDAAMKRLSSIADVSVAKDERGLLSITVGGRAPVVNGAEHMEIDVRRTPNKPDIGKKDGALSIYVKGPVAFDLTPFLKGGRLGALVEVRDTDIGKCQEQLNKVAHALVNNVNEIHRQGYGSDGISGRDFFSGVTDLNSAAEQIKVHDSILNSLESIAAGRSPNSPGDNRIAIAISNLSSKKGLLGEGDETITEIYNSMVGDLGVKTAAAERAVNFQKDILSQLDGFRESVSGVNLDEETTNLIRYQHAYAANAKVLQVASEVLESILNAFG